MAFLGLDFGKKRVGVALSASGILAEPLDVLEYSQMPSLLESLAKIISTNDIELVVVGVPSNDIIGARKFGERLGSDLEIPVEFVNEDLTSWQAQKIAKKTPITDDIAAVLILQEYLDNHADK